MPLPDRTCLRKRHRLSHQQIDQLLGENRSNEFVKDKTDQLEAVRIFLWITDQLRENNIPFVCIKGYLLSFLIYGDASVRISHDIDILVHTDHIDSSIKLLVREGYHLDGKLIWPDDKKQQEMVIGLCHHLSFSNPEKKSCVEIHWTLTPTLPVSQSIINDLVDGNLTEMEYSGRKFTVLKKEIELLFLLIHGSSHGWRRLKWLVDIHDYPLEDIDPDLFNSLATRLHAGRIIGQANFLLIRYFNKQLTFRGDAHIPAYFIRYAQQCIKEENKNAQTLYETIRFFRYQSMMFPTLAYRTNYLLGIFDRPWDIESLRYSSRMIRFLYRPYRIIKRRLSHE